jgi:lambda repressor-like predicted transcriptional regulator
MCQQSFTETFDTLYYRRQITPEEVRVVLQAHSEGSSLRGISRITGLAYETVVSVIDAATHKAQMVHNQELSDVDTESIGADEFWSFVEKSRNTATTKS